MNDDATLLQGYARDRSERDFAELGRWPERARILVIVGKGRLAQKRREAGHDVL